MPRYRVSITGKTYDAMADFVRKHKLNIAGHTGKKAGRSRFVVDAFADSDQIEGLRSEGYKVDVREDVQEAGKKRQLEVGSSAVRALTRNVATATHYLNVNDVENSLAAAASGPNAGFTRLLSSPTKPGKDESATPSRSRMALKAAVRARLCESHSRCLTRHGGCRLLEH